MNKIVLLVDGQNFLKKLQSVVLDDLGEKFFDRQKFDYKRLFNEALSGYNIDERIFYSAKIRQHPKTKSKSQQLIQEQRLLKTKLEKNGFDFKISGNVRGHMVKDPNTGKESLVFKEKGVDVAIAVDAVVMACDKKVKTVILCSSDSDLQPAVSQLLERKVEVVYLGFGTSPNKGLIFTANQTVLFREKEIAACL